MKTRSIFELSLQCFGIFSLSQLLAMGVPFMGWRRTQLDSYYMADWQRIITATSILWILLLLLAGLLIFFPKKIVSFLLRFTSHQETEEKNQTKIEGETIVRLFGFVFLFYHARHLALLVPSILTGNMSIAPVAVSLLVTIAAITLSVYIIRDPAIVSRIGKSSTKEGAIQSR